MSDANWMKLVKEAIDERREAASKREEYESLIEKRTAMQESLRNLDNAIRDFDLSDRYLVPPKLSALHSAIAEEANNDR